VSFKRQGHSAEVARQTIPRDSRDGRRSLGPPGQRAGSRPDSPQSVTSVHELSGLNSVIASASAVVFSPKSF
jgi:hypothetical protein